MRDARSIKKIMYGLTLSDGHIDRKNSRFEMYSKHLEFADFVSSVLLEITGVVVLQKPVIKNGCVIGHRLWTRRHPYFSNLGGRCYTGGRKSLTAYNVSRLDDQSMAMIWMCDGYLEHAKNRKTNKVQNIGWLCLEAFPKEELDILRSHLESLGIKSSLVKKPWGYGYRVRIGGENLQKFVSMVYPHVLPCFSRKTVLFYKSEKSIDVSLPSAEHIFCKYEYVEDIVRHPLKNGKT